MTIRDAQEQEASRSIIRGKSSQQGLSEMAGIAFMSEGADMVAHLICEDRATSRW
jgi:hypothetical protein